MSVHRIHDAAEAALQRVVKLEGKKPSEVLADLIIEYERGLSFSDTAPEPTRTVVLTELREAHAGEVEGAGGEASLTIAPGRDCISARTRLHHGHALHDAAPHHGDRR